MVLSAVQAQKLQSHVNPRVMPYGSPCRAWITHFLHCTPPDSALLEQALRSHHQTDATFCAHIRHSVCSNQVYTDSTTLRGLLKLSMIKLILNASTIHCPEGTACHHVLIAGNSLGSTTSYKLQARRVWALRPGTDTRLRRHERCSFAHARSG